MGHLEFEDGVDNGVEDILKDHPQYRDAFADFHYTLLNGGGPLPEYARRYIAIIATCRHRCKFLFDEQVQAFREAGGPEEWLQGLENLPKKYQELDTTNRLLAHRPWLYEGRHVSDLLRGSWTISELAQAYCIMAHFHALCSFVEGCVADNNNASLPPLNPIVASYQEVSPSHSPTSKELSDGGISAVIERMKKISMSEVTDMPEEVTQESFEKLKNQSISLVEPKEIFPVENYCVFSQFCRDLDFSYIDVGRVKNPPVEPLIYQDFAWEDLGYSILSQLMKEVADLLENKVKIGYNLTYFTCGNNADVDTSAFRRAVWNYLQCLYGIRHDDYDYGQVSKLMDRNLRSFLKATACYPERKATPPGESSFLKNIKHSEKIHILILVHEAKLQAELLYVLRAMGKC